MRFEESAGGITVEAIAGTYVVSLLMDATDNARDGLLGFALYRIDKTEKEEYWLMGMRTFQETAPPGLPTGTLVSTHENPIQDFAWGDFTAKPDHRYVYQVTPVYGKPKALKYGTAVELPVTTEKEEGSKHSVYFNRGVIGSQAYSRESTRRRRTSWKVTSASTRTPGFRGGSKKPCWPTSGRRVRRDMGCVPRSTSSPMSLRSQPSERRRRNARTSRLFTTLGDRLERAKRPSRPTRAWMRSRICSKSTV